MKVKLTVHRGVLVIETLDISTPYPGWTPIAPGLVGCVLEDTKASLGVSQEALDWMKQVKPSGDAIGEIMWWATQEGKKAFGWLGGLFKLVRLDSSEGLFLGQRGWQVFPEDCVLIPNEPPEEAMAAIERSETKRG